MKKKIEEAHKRAGQGLGLLSLAMVRARVSIATLSEIALKFRGAAALLEQAMEEKKNDGS